ncbi:MAG: ABC transporter ATP-binding protein [Candidatus Bipolaricaulota bacterium]|nr:ABC transporter ATP-binding protein [Candidatus Bipolaricaulota bacterium]MDW8030918.1 ABC transporter ATP-binding protein [Candidatus Bipolaricaulota bacterium]
MIALYDVSFSYDRKAVLDGITVEIPAGVTALLGPNGVGKTTLLRIILGVLRPQSGTVWIAGRSQTEYSRRELSQLIGLVPQNENITFDLSVKEYVLLGRAPYLHPWELPGSRDLQIVSEVLESLGILDLQDRAVLSLSGGERQLVIIARALAQQPKILLLDEPTAHLDLRNQAYVVTVIRQLAAAGLSVLFTTHDPNLALAVADYTVLLRRGSGCWAGPTATLLTAENLSRVYEIPVEVLSVDGHAFIRTR